CTIDRLFDLITVEKRELLKYKSFPHLILYFSIILQYGMTPLMHAAYKGKADMCHLLLQHGADVNCNQHEYGYTALMFAGLSGKTDITSMMLDAGAETSLVNSVGRTAAQMAAFVGQHDCVTVINNFFSRARLEYYTRPQGLEREPKLPPVLAGPLHRIIMTTNLNPVKIVMLVKENPVLVDVAALEKCYQVMDLLCEQCVKQQGMNEVQAMKMHYISCVLQKCSAFLQKRDDKLDALVKSLLRGRDSDGFPQYQEKFIRDCIRKFPYCEATLLQQLVRRITLNFGNDPTVFSVLTQALTGQMAFIDADYCATCGERGADKRCSPCKAVIYCSLTCQKLHWFTHKKLCRSIQEQSANLDKDVPRFKELKGAHPSFISKKSEGTYCLWIPMGHHLHFSHLADAFIQSDLQVITRYKGRQGEREEVLPKDPYWW
uniref:MYND-type domain-containing protein n=1 Tax=Anabas testudineus TaxID=64144 RepID=A0A3Q1IHM4_ANATE